MKPAVYVESPEGEVLTGNDNRESLGEKDPKSEKPDNEWTGPAEEPVQTDKDDLAAGPKSNPDPRANANLSPEDGAKESDGAGTEITDGEAG